MRRYLRLILVIVVTALFWAAGRYTDFAHDPALIKALAGFFAIVTALLWAFFRLLGSTTGVGVLTGREMERYTEVRKDIRRRFWFVFGMCAMCSAALWILSEFAKVQPAGESPPWLPSIVGLLFAVNLTYAIAVGRWIDDLSHFTDSLRTREQRQKDSEAMLKRLAEAKKRTAGA